MALRAKRAQAEYKKAKENLPAGILKCQPVKESDLSKWEGVFQGPEGGPYEGGVFKVSITLPERYPLSPPRVTFDVRVYHPNISSNGDICLSILKPGKWSSATTLPMLLVAIRSLLAEPNPDDPLVQSIASQFEEDPLKFHKIAREWTLKFAKNT